MVGLYLFLMLELLKFRNVKNGQFFYPDVYPLENICLTITDIAVNSLYRTYPATLMPSTDHRVIIFLRSTYLKN